MILGTSHKTIGSFPMKLILSWLYLSPGKHLHHAVEATCRGKPERIIAGLQGVRSQTGEGVGTTATSQAYKKK
jgi:hypothetical protein